MHIQDEHPFFVWMHLPYEMSTTSRIHSASLFLLLVPRRHPALQVDDDDVGRRSEDDNEPKEHRGRTMNIQKTTNFEALQPAGAEYELTDIEIQQLKEHNQKRVKRVVGFVAIAMTLLSLALVAFSLALGRKIDLMVEQKVEERMEIYTAHGINLTETRS
ncbi:unnamed protein product [Caenorhabditis nigoni]